MATVDLHRLGEERSLAMHRVVLERLLTDPRLIEAARNRVRRWLETGEVHREYAEAWAALLAGDPARLAEAVVDPGERGCALPQASPFAGVLTPRERWRIRADVARQFG